VTHHPPVAAASIARRVDARGRAAFDLIAIFRIGTVPLVRRFGLFRGVPDTTFAASDGRI
jgi:hypothetical protein